VKNLSEETEQELNKQYIAPDMVMCPNDEHTEQHIEITLPGVNKEDITLKMHEDSFLIKGETSNTVYIGTYGFCCPVDYENAKAKYNNGLLKIDVPYKTEFESVDVNIE
jgi:HSP20 family protein